MSDAAAASAPPWTGSTDATRPKMSPDRLLPFVGPRALFIVWHPVPTKRPTRVAEVCPRPVATPSDAGFIAAKQRSRDVFQREVRR